MKYSCLIFVIIILAAACDSSEEYSLQFEKKGRNVPAFNVDSAYQKLVHQVEFGPRNPGTASHQNTQEYLTDKLSEYAGKKSVFVQRFKHQGYDSDTLEMANIIAAFNPQSTDRIMLCAHWDTRPRADQDSTNANQPIAGADDGASGVAVLLELARIFKNNPPPIGVDLILFDGEDYGKEGDLANYFLGSRYWSNYPPVQGYQPRFGVLLDMVGGKNATFLKEGYSMEFAPGLVNELWNIADEEGYNSLFVDEMGARISDDHVIVNRIRNIPMIDIINHSTNLNGNAEFAPYWHTQNDDLNIIDKRTIGAVGEVLTELIYNRL